MRTKNSGRNVKVNFEKIYMRTNKSERNVKVNIKKI